MFIDSPQALALLTKISRSVAPWVFGGSRGARSSWEGRKTGNRSSFHGKRSEFPCSFALLKRSLPALLLPKFLRSKWVRGSTLRNFNYVPRCYTLIGQMMSVEISLIAERQKTHVGSSMLMLLGGYLVTYIASVSARVRFAEKV